MSDPMIESRIPFCFASNATSAELARSKSCKPGTIMLTSGVTPDVSAIAPGLHDFDRSNPADVAFDAKQNAILDSIIGSDKLCRTH